MPHRFLPREARLLALHDCRIISAPRDHADFGWLARKGYAHWSYPTWDKRLRYGSHVLWKPTIAGDKRARELSYVRQTL